MGSCQITKYRINLDLIGKYVGRFMVCVCVGGGAPTMDRCMAGWVYGWVGSCQITKNQISLNLIEIFQFCLKIFGWEYG